MQVLAFVYELGSVTRWELAELMECTGPAAIQLLRYLWQKGCLTRREINQIGQGRYPPHAYSLAAEGRGAYLNALEREQRIQQLKRTPFKL